MKQYIFFIWYFIVCTGCTVHRQHQLERRALDSIWHINAAGAITDSIYTLKK